ncbi:MAG: ATP-binding cassette domain-containing protein, partial [Propionibacteriaceae bacterium]|nr:ATP-binding cassette domain-containing protein [Propionibacteriaceae bacterium]
MVRVAKKDIVLKAEKLKKAYGPVTIIEGFDLKVMAGEAVALTGRNGAGKSTVLRCLVGADRPDEGKVEVLGVRMNET